jgi:Ca2+-binding RTX toxin-like protein
MVCLHSPETAEHPSGSAVASISSRLHHTLVVIDAGVGDYQHLVAGVTPGVRVLVLKPDQDGIHLITQALKTYSNITTLHLVAHGAPGCLTLGNTQLNLNTLDRYAWDLTSWFSSPRFQPATLLLYGCHVAAGEIGTTFLAKLRHLTEAEIAASSTPIGNSRLGGNWDLDVTTGAVKFLPAFQIGVLEAYPAIFDNTYHKLSSGAFAQNWSNPGLITVDHDWSGVPSIIGYRGDDLVAMPGADPRTVVADGTSTPVDVNANKNSPNSFTAGGIAEFAIANPTIAIQGSGTADAPFLLLHLDTTGASGIQVSYNLRDLDSTSDNAVSQVALQYRIGETGDFINLPDGYVADASTASSASQVSPVKVTLPSAVDNQPKVQIRIIGTDAVGNDEWIGIDDISVIASRGNQAPVLTGNATLTAVDEDIDNAINTGSKITDLIRGLSTDADNDPQAIAVTGVDNSNGSWQYSINGGATWIDFGNALSDNSAVILGATSLYSAQLSTAPASQGWLAFANVSGATETVNSNGAILNTTLNNSIYAGYSNFNGATPVHSTPIILDNQAGYSISFNLQMLGESRTNQNRAGFSIIAVSKDKKAIELGFQQLSPTTGKIFAQDPSFIAAESIAYNTNLDIDYTLKVAGNQYKLFADGTEILAGELRDYSGFTGFPDPYETPNFIFLGDDTTSAQGWFNLSQVVVQTDTRLRFVPNPNYNGTANVSFRIWDTSNGLANGATGVDTSLNGNGTAYSAAVGTASVTINPNNDNPTGVVTIDGTAQENQTLTVNTTGLNDIDGLGTFSYQWQLGDGTVWTNIAGATNSSFMPSASQVGGLIRVQLTYMDQQGTTEMVDSASTAAIASNPSPKLPPEQEPAPEPLPDQKPSPIPDSSPDSSPVRVPLVLTFNNDTGVASNDGIINTNQPRFGGQVQPGSEIRVFAGQILLGTVMADAAGNWVLTTPNPLVDGKYEVFYTSTNQAGATVTSPKRDLLIDTTPSNVLFVTGNAVRETSTDRVTIRFSEVVKNLDLSDFILQHDGVSVALTNATLTTTDDITWTLDNLGSLTTAEGRYQLTLKQSDIVDLAGNRLVADVPNAWVVLQTGLPLPQIRFKNGKAVGLRRSGDNDNNRLIGTPLNDILKGGGGNDLIVSGFGKAQFGVDWLEGGDGDDRLISGSGNDRLVGGSGNDWLKAGKGDDSLQGGDGNDRLIGNAGHDVIVGGSGNDRLTGGRGRDTFVYSSLTDGTDTITDFSQADLLDLRLIFVQPEFRGDSAAARFTEFVSLEQVGMDVKVSVDADGIGSETKLDTLTVLQNTTLAKVSASNFLIA